MAKRVLIFSLVYYPRFIGGAEVAVKEITDRISPGEIEFDMVTMRKHAPAFERIGNVNVYRVGLPSKYFFIFWALLKALKLHKTRKYDAIWSIMANYAGFSALFFKTFRPSVPFYLTLQEGDPFDHIRRRVGALYPLFKKIFTKADKIQAISKYLANWAKEMGATCPIAVVPNGVDIKHFAKTSEKAPDIIRGMREKGASTILVTTSRLVKKNAVGDVIKSLAILPKSVHFLILGTGPLDAELLSETKRIGVLDRVVFGGFVAHEELPAYLHASDIFIRPSLSEGLGNSFLEAMAAGIPVIATPVGGIVDFLRHGETGLFVEVGDPDDISRKVEKLIKDREARDYMVSEAGKMVSSRYNWDNIAGEMHRRIIG